MRKFKELYTNFLHKQCIQAAIDQHNKQTKTHTALVEELQSDIRRLNREILFTQESYELEIKALTKQLLEKAPL